MEKALFQIGSILKTHGVHGECVLLVNNDIVDAEIKLIDEPVFLYSEGLPVPFFVITQREKSSETYLVKFRGLETETLASEFVGSKVSIASDDFPDIELTDGVSIDLIDYTVVDTNAGEIGVVDDIVDYSGNIVVQVVSDNKEEFLFPYNETFIIEIDDDKKLIKVDLPEEMLDINK